MKNIAFNYYDQLIDAAKENISLREEVESLDEALANADEELKELKKPKKKAGKTEEWFSVASVKLETRNEGRGLREWDYVPLSEPRVVTQ